MQGVIARAALQVEHKKCLLLWGNLTVSAFISSEPAFAINCTKASICRKLKLPALSALPVIFKHSHAKTHHPVFLQEIIMEVKADFSKQKVDLLVAIEQLQRAARNLKANELGRSATIFLTSSRFLDAEC